MITEEVDRERIFSDIKRVFIKASSRLLFENDENDKLKYPLRLDKYFSDRLAREICDLRTIGIRNRILISGGAELAGMMEYSCDKNSYNGMTEQEMLRHKQFFTSIGWNTVINQYRKSFGDCNQKIGSVLLTSEDFNSEEHAENIINVHKTAKGIGALLIYNNNDATSTAELGGYSENDQLTADFAITYKKFNKKFDLSYGNDLVIFLSEYPFCDKNPSKHEDAKIIPVIYCPISDHIMNLADEGMKQKIYATGKLGNNGIVSVIVKGKYSKNYRDIIIPLLKGEPLGTLVLPRGYKKLS